ncbi:MAG: cupin domain-containing protein [Hyphomicrobiaceae bacterium]
MASAQVTIPNNARSVWIAADHVRFMGDLPDDGWGVVDVTVPPGAGTPAHRHASPEAFLVTEGEITFGFFDDHSSRFAVARVGTVVTIPSRLGHNYTNNSNVPARFTAVVQTEMLRFFEEAGSPEAPPPVPPSDQIVARLMAACARHGIEILTPP